MSRPALKETLHPESSSIGYEPSLVKKGPLILGSGDEKIVTEKQVEVIMAKPILYAFVHIRGLTPKGIFVAGGINCLLSRESILAIPELHRQLREDYQVPRKKMEAGVIWRQGVGWEDRELINWKLYRLGLASRWGNINQRFGTGEGALFLTDGEFFSFPSREAVGTLAEYLGILNKRGPRLAKSVQNALLRELPFPERERVGRLMDAYSSNSAFFYTKFSLGQEEVSQELLDLFDIQQAVGALTTYFGTLTELGSEVAKAKKKALLKQVPGPEKSTAKKIMDAHQSRLELLLTRRVFSQMRKDGQF